MGLGFSAACDVQNGDTVIRGSKPRVVCGTCHRGKDWPYFLVREYAEVLRSEDAALPTPPPGFVWVSWQTCG